MSSCYPGATATQALGLNNHVEVVGVYTTGSGSSTQNFGFTWTEGRGFITISDPAGVGSTTVNGVNDLGDLVGFYVDSSGNTDGMLVTPNPIQVPTNTASTMTANTSTISLRPPSSIGGSSSQGGSRPTTASWSLQKNASA